MSNTDRVQIKNSIESLIAAIESNEEIPNSEKAIGLSILGIATALVLDINRMADSLEELVINTKGRP